MITIGSITYLQDMQIKMTSVPLHPTWLILSHPLYHMHSWDNGYSRTYICPQQTPTLHQNTILPHQIREIKIICSILKIRISNCSLQPVTWEMYKFFHIDYTSRVILELFIEVLSHNKSLSNTAIGLIHKSCKCLDWQCLMNRCKELVSRRQDIISVTAKRKRRWARNSSEVTIISWHSSWCLCFMLWIWPCIYPELHNR